MVEHEPHLVPVAVDPAYAAPKRGDQVVQVLEQNVGQNGSFQVAPQSLDQVEARAAGWQPEDCNLMAMRLQPFLGQLFLAFS